MTIQWSGEDESPERPRRKVLPAGTMVGVLMDLEEGSLPSARSPRDVAVVLALLLVLIVLGTILWFVVGPLPRVFPLMS